MSHKQMTVRCPGSRFISAAKLDGYKFVYDGYEDYRKGAVGNIVSEAGNVVWGALYEVTLEHLVSLDGIETGNMAYQRVSNLSVTDAMGKAYENVHVYLRPPLPLGRPSDEYRNIILEGAEDSGLPENYRTFLQAA